MRASLTIDARMRGASVCSPPALLVWGAPRHGARGFVPR